MFDGNVMQVAVRAMVDREVEAQLGLPAVPEAAQNRVSREVVEEPVELKVRVDAGRNVVLLRGLLEFLDRLHQPGPLRPTQRWYRELPGIRFDKQADRGDLSDVLRAHLRHECPAEGHLDDQPLLLESRQCLAEGRTADAEICRDVPLAQLTAGRHRAVEDGCTQHAVDTLWRR